MSHHDRMSNIVVNHQTIKQVLDWLFVAALQFRLVAFVFMPEHLRLLVFPTGSDATSQCLSDFLVGVKVPY